MADAAVPVPAATILMLRDGDEGVEVFMVVRHHQIDFASGALVFPGGKVDDGDFRVADRCVGIDDVDATEAAMMAGAIREAFEECGILLARPAGAAHLVDAERLKSLEHYREKLNRGDLLLRDFLEIEDLELACDCLVPFAHWVTPDMMPKRFDTKFYLAAAPSDHLAVHDGQESVDSVWIRPEDALAGIDTGQYTIIFPTRLNVEMLDESQSVESAFADAAAREIVTVLPWMEQREDGMYLCIPPDAGYRISEEKMERAG